MGTFKAVVVEKGEGGQSVGVRDFDENDLMEGDVTARVTHSTLNYKDGLALTGKAPVVRRFPMIPGIDFAGVVESSSHPDFKPGDRVVLNGWGTGETHLGAYGEKSRVKGDWLIPLPEGLIARAGDGDRHGGLHRHAGRYGAGEARADARGRPGGRDRCGRRRRLGRDRAPRQDRLACHRLDRPDAGGRLFEGARRGRDHRPQRTEPAGEAARQGALGGGRRFGRLA